MQNKTVNTRERNTLEPAFKAVILVLLIALLCHALLQLVRFGLMFDGINQLAACRWAGAAARFSSCLSIFGPAPDAYLFRAMALAGRHKLGDREAGIQDLLKAAVIGEPTLRVLLNTAALQTEYSNDSGFQDYSEAIASCSRAIALDPRSADAYKLRAVCNIRSNNFAAAEADATRALELGRDPASSAKLYQVRASCRIALHQYDGAIQDLSRALQIVRVPELLVLRARAYYLSGLYEKAAGDDMAALKMADKRVTRCQALLNLAKSRLATGDPGKALKALSDAIVLDDRSTAAYLLRGTVLLDQHEWDRAALDFKRVLAIQPESKEAKDRLAVTLSCSNTRIRQ